MGNWEKVFESEVNYKAEIVRDVLENHGLSPVILNKKEFYTQMGVYEVRVKEDEILSAIKIIKDEVKFG